MIDKITKAVASAYPGAAPFFYIEYNGRLLVSIGDPDVPEDERIMDFHEIDRDTFSVSGSIPNMELFGSDGFVEALKRAKPISEKKKIF